MGLAPRCFLNNLDRCRGPIPRRSASTSAPAPSSAPLLINRKARSTVVCEAFHAGENGAVSGRHLRQGEIRPARLQPRTDRTSHSSPGWSYGTNRPAVNPCCSEAGEEQAVVPSISSYTRALAHGDIQFPSVSEDRRSSPIPANRHLLQLLRYDESTSSNEQDKCVPENASSVGLWHGLRLPLRYSLGE